MSLDSAIRSFLLLACALGLAPGVGARDNSWQAGEDNAAWRAECSTCHAAFPPSLLPASAWLAIMARLDQHFGTDASLDAKTRQEISDYLMRHGSGPGLPGNDAALPRITQTERFANKHRSAIRLWRKGQLKSLSDCAACHRESAKAALPE